MPPLLDEAEGHRAACDRLAPYLGCDDPRLRLRIALTALESLANARGASDLPDSHDEPVCLVAAQSEPVPARKAPLRMLSHEI